MYHKVPKNETMYDYEDYENDLEREEWLRRREEYLEEQADLDYYERRYYSNDFD